MIEVNDGLAGRSGPAIRQIARTESLRWVEQLEVAQRERPTAVWSIGGVASGYEAFSRVHTLGVTMVGGAQAFYRAADPALIAERWSSEYQAAARQAAHTV